MTADLVASGPGAVRRLFDQHLAVGLHHGAQLAVYRGDRLVIDCAGGVTGPAAPDVPEEPEADGDGENEGPSTSPEDPEDPEDPENPARPENPENPGTVEARETTPDTRHVLFSCTKPLAGVCLHRLAEEGAVSYDDAVVSHWPGFADSGSEKSEVTIRQVLSHQAGLPTSPIDADPEAWTDWEAAVAAMESARLAFAPGSMAAYHALTYGFVVGELVRRVSGTPVDEYARTAVFEPLGMDRTSIGLPEAVASSEVATLSGFAPGERCRDPGTGLGTITNDEAADLFNREWLQRAVVPASTGIGTARDLARFFACLANGGALDGVRILEPETVARATEVQVEVERDGTLGVPRRYAMGLERAGTVWDKYGTVAPARVFGHGGLGSVVGWGDPETGVGFAYVTNGIREEFEHATRANAAADAVRTVLS